MKSQSATSSHQNARLEKAKQALATNSCEKFSAVGQTLSATATFEAASVAGVFSTEALLSLQGALSPTPTDRESVSNEHKMLDNLQQTHKDILLESFSRASLEDLAPRIRAEREKASLLKVEPIREVVELRADVELAKLSYSMSRDGITS